jgi:LmbE family N-acetylglucosaminyl deacetylase
MKKDFIIRQEQRQPIRQLYGWLKSLQSTLIFMQTGAHPDDETSRMLARLSLGDGMHVVYVNAVRGQGGQNALGPERGDALGFLRTEELFEAMKLLRADIGWLAETPDDPIRDFGFSKSAEQTFEKWGSNHTLRQMVKMVRLFKPDILIPTFLDVPGQHGHHRAVTKTTISAFYEAASHESFADLGQKAWQVNTLYLPAWGGGGGSYDDEVPPPKATHEILTGEYDAIMGGTYAQIGEWSRACHATQGMGQRVDEEERPVPLHQLLTASGRPILNDLTDGVPVNLAALAPFCENDTGRKAAFLAQQAADDALSVFPDGEAVLAAMCRLQSALLTLEKSISSVHMHRIHLKMRQAAMAASEAAALQIQLDISPSVPKVGHFAEARLSWHVSDISDVPKLSAKLIGPDQLTFGSFDETEGSGRRRTMTAPVKISGPPLDPMVGWHGLMVAPANLHAEVSFYVGESQFVLPVCPNAVFATKPVKIGRLAPARTLLRLEEANNMDMQLSLDEGLIPVDDALLSLPVGWQFETSADVPSGTVSGRLRVPETAWQGHYRIHASVDGDSIYDAQSLSYPHIRGQTHFYIATADIALVNTASLRSLKIGWIDGGVDEAFRWAEQLGAQIIQLDDSDLRSGRFEGLDVIVAGVFAGGTRPFNQSMRYIRPWIEAGGHLVTQYHRPIDNWDQKTSSPLPLLPGSPSIRWRVTDASAPVQILQPNHSLLLGPNEISSEDFDGWVKERGLYFASEWDPAYIPLLAMADGEETLLKGGLLCAQIGSGTHIHCALNLFYQMDHMVPGAFRLFANLLTPHT